MPPEAEKKIAGDKWEQIRQTLREILTHKITANTVVLFSGRLLASGVGFLCGIIIARNLTPTDFGLLSMTLAVFEIAVVIAGMGIGTSLARFVPLCRIKDENQGQYYLKVGFWALLTFSLVIAGLGLLGTRTIALTFYNKPRLLVPLRLAFLAVISGILWNFFLSSLHAREMFARYSCFAVIVGLLKLAGIGLLVWWGTFDVVHVLWLYILVPLLGFVLGIAYTPTSLLRARGEFKKTLLTLVSFGKWIFVIDVAVMLFFRIDVLILGYYVREEVLGFYSVAFQMMFVFTILTSSFINVLLPHVSKFEHMRQIRRYVKSISKVTLGCSLLFLPVLVSVGPIIRLLFGNAYAPAVEIFQIMFFGFLFNFMVEPIYLVVYPVNKPQIIALVCVIKLLLSASANLLLIPYYGAEGAASASVFTHVVGGCIALAVIYKYVYKRDSFVATLD